MNTRNLAIAQACDRAGEECTMPREVAGEAGGWMPIETAPIRPFNADVWFSDHSPRLLLYPGPRIGAYGYTKKGKGRWTSWSGVVYPTHWMPLPAAPIALAQTSKEQQQ